jgi:O-antigen/teichoic acid export membrane protein
MVCALVALVFVQRRHWHYSHVPFFAMGLASVAASVVLMPYLLASKARSTSGPNLGAILGSHWAYGRWVSGAAVVSWVVNCAYSSLLVLSRGLDATGAYRAAENLFLPLLHAAAALTTLLLPWAASQAHKGSSYLRAFCVSASLIVTGPALCYFFVVTALGDFLILRLYERPFYAAVPALLPVLGGAVVLRAVSDIGLATPLRAAGRPDAVFWSSAGGALITMTVGVALVHSFGLLGAAIGLLAATAVQAAVLTAFVARVFAPSVCSWERELPVVHGHRF